MLASIIPRQEIERNTEQSIDCILYYVLEKERKSFIHKIYFPDEQ